MLRVSVPGLEGEAAQQLRSVLGGDWGRVLLMKPFVHDLLNRMCNTLIHLIASVYHQHPDHLFFLKPELGHLIGQTGVAAAVISSCNRSPPIYEARGSGAAIAVRLTAVRERQQRCPSSRHSSARC